MGGGHLGQSFSIWFATYIVTKGVSGRYSEYKVTQFRQLWHILTGNTRWSSELAPMFGIHATKQHFSAFCLQFQRVCMRRSYLPLCIHWVSSQRSSPQTSSSLPDSICWAEREREKKTCCECPTAWLQHKHSHKAGVIYLNSASGKSVPLSRQVIRSAKGKQNVRAPPRQPSPLFLRPAPTDRKPFLSNLFRASLPQNWRWGFNQGLVKLLFHCFRHRIIFSSENYPTASERRRKTRPKICFKTDFLWQLLPLFLFFLIY